MDIIPYLLMLPLLISSTDNLIKTYMIYMHCFQKRLDILPSKMENESYTGNKQNFVGLHQVEVHYVNFRTPDKKG